jgi:Leucine-rich repeat (LRR) protein
MDLTPIKGLTALQVLDLDSMQITDLAPLEGLTALRWLDLAGTPVADLAPLEDLPNLGSGLIDYSQKMMAAAMQMAEK